MRKQIGNTAIAIVGPAIAAAILSTGVASADDYAGKTYADVQSALASAGMKGVIASRSGDTMPNDKCVVTSSEKAPWIKGDKFATVTDTVLLNLNCSASVADTTHPGNSAASPEGRAAIAAAKQQAAQNQAQAATGQTTKKH
ncbi:hypothetical protein P3H80_00395 [Mycolicibacterium septicum]|uniref:hypothetical protein n=1 Tax=Mycolicibacterium septicum TaxID=98668 RepID=UPI0023E33282|nr:hypothetical protein [Mycolicibacterium septicum]MDF3335856.1 hypothetical protein [Mycolicibacterium septicum]